MTFKKNIAYLLFGWSTLFALLSIGCRREEMYDETLKVPLQFSRDTIAFDTVFTTLGSATANFKVKNPNKEGVRVSNIFLGGGESSPYRINVNGRATTSYPGLELAGEDSIFVFVEVTIDPNNVNLPFIVTDSIGFKVGDKTKYIPLVAFGQNARFFTEEVLPCNTTWDATLPYVIRNYVGIAEGCRLTVAPGVKIYLHKGAGILVGGTLQMLGAAGSEIVISGTRLEQTYEREPGQWYGIRFLPKSTNNIIRYTTIQNATLAVEVDSLSTVPGTPNLIIDNSTIRYNSSAGLVAYTAHIESSNLLIHASGDFPLVGDLGGTYRFTHATIDHSGGRSSAGGRAGVVFTNAEYRDGGGVVINNPLTINLTNCIISGNGETELEIREESKNPLSKITAQVTFNLLKSKSTLWDASNILNLSPAYKNVLGGDLSLDSISPAIDRGTLTPITIDRKGLPRNNVPDIGAYEYAR